MIAETFTKEEKREIAKKIKDSELISYSPQGK